MFSDLVSNHKPECRFSGSDRKYFLSWKKKTLRRVLATLGDPPPAVPAKPELIAEWQDKGLIAPRPLLIDIGVNDSCFKIDTAMKCYNQLSKIYQAAGAEDCLELDLHTGEHRWGANKSEEFFTKHLRI